MKEKSFSYKSRLMGFRYALNGLRKFFQQEHNAWIHPLQNKMEWSMISTWALFMTLFYFTIEKMSESFLARYHQNK